MSINNLYGNFRDYVSLKGVDDLREMIAQADWFLSERGIRAASHPSVKHLAQVEESGAEGQLIASLKAEQAGLCWRPQFAANRFGAEFDSNTAFMEMVGDVGHFDSREFGGGFMLLGPELTVPIHKYSCDQFCISLSNGSEWVLGGGTPVAQSAGDVFAVESYDSISIQTKSNPVIVLVLWRGGEFVAET